MLSDGTMRVSPPYTSTARGGAAETHQEIKSP
jgi:hypothetical protein